MLEAALKPRVISSKDKLARLLIVLGAGAMIATKGYLLAYYLDPFTGLYSFLTTFLVFVSFVITYAKYKDPCFFHDSHPAKENSFGDYAKPLVSVVIPAKNDPIMIGEAVRSCLTSTYQNVEVVMVNDGSTDNTGEVMDALHQEYPTRTRVIHLEKNLGKRKAIREGILNGPARGDIVLLVDSDCRLEGTAIERLIRVFARDSNIGAVCGHARAINHDQNFLTKMQDTWYDGQFSIMKAVESVFSTVTCLPGVLSAYRKEAILPALDAWANDKFLGAEFVLGDDRHLTSYVIGGNKHYLGKEYRVWKTKYCESAVVYTEVPYKWKKFILQQIRWKKSWFRVFFFTAPYYYKDRPLFAAALYYLQMIWSSFSPIVGARSLIILPLQGEYTTGIVYVAGIILLGLLFGAEFKMRNPGTGSKWAYRLVWGLIGLFLSSLEFYSLATIRNKSWLTR